MKCAELNKLHRKSGYGAPGVLLRGKNQRPWAWRNSFTTCAGSRCCPSTASFMVCISSAVTLPGQAGKGASQLRPPVQRFLPHQRNRLVRRKVMLIVLKHGQMKSFDRTIS